MRKLLAWILAATFVATSGIALAREGPNGTGHPLDLAPRTIGESNLDLPARAPGYGRADTVSYGYYGGANGYAVAGEMWTFDHGGNPLEGWYAVDLTANPTTYFRRITATTWSGHGNAVAAPIIAGTGSAWVGAFEDQADALCWAAGLGYGNGFCQRYTSPELTYLGAGSIQLTMSYFNDTEANFDYSRVILRTANGTETILNGPSGFTGPLGNPGAGVYLPFVSTMTAGTFQGQTKFRLIFEMESDGGWSDEDGSWPTEFGPFGVDDISLSGSVVEGPQTWNFEAGDHGFTAGTCAAVGTFFSASDISNYVIADPCVCALTGNVLEAHDANFGHPYGQHIYMSSNIVDKRPLGPAYNTIFADWDQYVDLPMGNGVFYRPGWNYYPFVCPQTGSTQWSGRQGQAGFFFVGDDPVCFRTRSDATTNGIPGSAELLHFIYELYASCDAFGITPAQCTQVTNFTPILDNLEVRVTGGGNAPGLSFAIGCFYQDAYGTALTLSSTNAGNADVSFNLNLGDTNALPAKLGDSLVVIGPVPTPSTNWDAKMWWRIKRIGPAQGSVAGYTTWRDAVADGRNIVGASADFTFGRMDSVQVGTAVTVNQFISEFREDDDDFAGENTNNNEMIRDGILAPGTKVEYFVSAAFINNPVNFLLPDTVGGFYLDFEVLPSYQNIGGIHKFPCLLLLDLNTGAEPFIQNALNVVLNSAGPGEPIPDPTTWDKYDYAFAASNFNAPFSRDLGSTAGCTVTQLLGYRSILANTGTLPSGTMESEDFQLFNDWLTAVICDGNTFRQGFIGNGDSFANNLLSRAPAGPAFLVNVLGANSNCDSYNASGCGPTPPDESECVRINAAPGALYPAAITYDAYGNWCPTRYRFDVLGTVGSGTGNRVYNDYDGVPPVNTSFAQVVRSVTGPGSDNYRTVLDGISWHHLSERVAIDECIGDSAHIVTASYREIQSALNWIFGGPPTAYCLNPCEDTSGLDDGTQFEGGKANRLYQNQPNPFNPRTTIKFSLAEAGKAELIIFDVNGRKVRTLLDGPLGAGPHELIWDGTDDRGHSVGTGIFWSQLSARAYSSSKKMVILK